MLSVEGKQNANMDAHIKDLMLLIFLAFYPDPSQFLPKNIKNQCTTNVPVEFFAHSLFTIECLLTVVLC